MVMEEQSEGQRNVKMVGFNKISNGAATGEEEEGASESSYVCGGEEQALLGCWTPEFGRGQGEG